MGKKRDEVDETTSVAIRPGGGNVFADLGLDDPEGLMAKAKLAARVCDIIAERRLTPDRAAELLGIESSEIVALMDGKLDDYPTDRLFRFLNALGARVEIVIRNVPRGEPADTRVVMA